MAQARPKRRIRWTATKIPAIEIKLDTVASRKVLAQARPKKVYTVTSRKVLAQARPADPTIRTRI